MAEKTVTVSPGGALVAGCLLTYEAYWQGVKPPQYQGAATHSYTNYQLIATGVDNWRPKQLKVTHVYTYSDGTISQPTTITYDSGNYGDTNPWNFPANKVYDNWANPFEYVETDPGTETRLRTVDDTITAFEAVFEESTPPPPTTYTIATAVSPSGSGTTTGDGTYNVNTEVTLEVTPNSGYRVSYWEKNGTRISGSDGQLSILVTVTENATYTAVLKAFYHVQVVAFRSDNSLVTLNGEPGVPQSAWSVAEGDFDYGDTITIAASVPDPVISPFKGWYKDPSAWGNPEGSGTLVVGAGPTYTTTVTASVVYFATYDFLGTTVRVYTRSEHGINNSAPDAVVSVNGHSNNTNDFWHVLLRGDYATIGTTAYGGLDVYGDPLYFTGWTNAADPSQQIPDNLQYTLQTSTSPSATWYNFVANYDSHYTLTTSVMPVAAAGRITASPPSKYGNNLYAEWTNVTLTATPTANYRFVKWILRDQYGDEDISTSSAIVVQITYRTNDYTYIAVFEWNGTNLLVNSSNLGSPVQLVYDDRPGGSGLLVADY